MRFGRKEKLSPRYLGTYEILQRVCELAYELSLPAKLDSVHPYFHVSILELTSIQGVISKRFQ